MSQEIKKHLKVVAANPGTVVTGTTCFAVHATANVDCKRQRCPHWIDHQPGHNCVHIAAQNGTHTLQQIGKIYGLTRMRICQVEKSILKMIREAS